MNIVIVDDHEDMAEMLRQVLTLSFGDEHGTVTTITSDFERVFDEAMWADKDVAVVDVMLPDLDGRALLYWLKTNCPNVRRVAWSAGAVEHLEDAHAHAVVEKPAAFDTILAAIRG